MANETGISRYLPIAGWLPTSTSASVRTDVVAGIAVAGLLVPEGMAYAGIAGVAPQIGLYAAMAGMFVYALFGTSRQLAVTATSSSAAMTAALVAPLAGGDPLHYATLVAAAAIAAGLIFLGCGLFKVGSIVEFISKPVLKGFVFGLGLTIIVKQMAHFTGIPRGQGNFFGQLWHVLKSIHEVNPTTLFLGVVSLSILALLGTFAPRVPSALVVLVLGILAVRLLGLESRGVEVVGDVQGSMPSFAIPRIGTDDLPEVFVGTLGIVVVLAAEGLAAGRTFAAKHKYETDANQELVAMGAANVVSGLLGGLIVGGGMSGTAANDAGGARTQLSTITGSVFVALTLAFLMPSIRQLPEAVLAAIVIHAVAHLVDFKLLKYYARIQTGSVWIASIAIASVLLLGILKGLILAVAVTLVIIMKKLSAPHESLLGLLPGTQRYVDRARFPDARPVEGMLIVRPNGILFFANANRFLHHVRTLVHDAEPSLRAVIIDLRASPETDITSIEMLTQLDDELKEAGVALYFARVPDRVLDQFRRCDLLAKLGADRICPDVSSAVMTAQENPQLQRA